MKQEIDIITVIDGVIKEIRMLGKMYQVSMKREKQKPIEKKIATASVSNAPTIDMKGRKIGTSGHTAIYENVLNAVRDMPYERQMEVIKRFYPHYEDISLKTALSRYRVVIDDPSKLDRTRTATRGNYSRKKETSRRRYRKRKPADAIAFNKTHGVWIRQPDVLAVKRAINKFGLNYKPTRETLLIETGLSTSRLQSTINYLKKIDELVAVRDGKSARVLYKPKIRLEQ